MELALTVNPTLLPADRQTLRKLLQKTSAKGTWDAYSYLTSEQRSAIRLKYAASNELVAQKYLGGPWANFFPTETHALPSPAIDPGLTLSAGIQILIKLLLELRRQSQTQIQELREDHHAQLRSLKDQLKQTKTQLNQLEKRTRPLLQHRQNLSRLCQSRLLCRLSKWEQKLSRFWARQP
jgi:hypothetical protein